MACDEKWVRYECGGEIKGTEYQRKYGRIVKNDMDKKGVIFMDDG